MTTVRRINWAGKQPTRGEILRKLLKQISQDVSDERWDRAEALADGFLGLADGLSESDEKSDD